MAILLDTNSLIANVPSCERISHEMLNNYPAELTPQEFPRQTELIATELPLGAAVPLALDS